MTRQARGFLSAAAAVTAVLTVVAVATWTIATRDRAVVRENAGQSVTIETMGKSVSELKETVAVQGSTVDRILKIVDRQSN